MQIWEILLIGFAVSMDAFAVGMTDGMTEPRMKVGKAAVIAALFGGFQFLMPVIGYYCGTVFASLVHRIAPWLSFVLLAFLGGKSIVDFILEQKRRKRGEAETSAKTAGPCKLLVQAVATSIDALVIGVTLLAAETTVGLPMHVVLCCLVIGGITLSLSFAAVLVGRKAGDKFADKAELLGGVILVAIGVKILVEGIVG